MIDLGKLAAIMRQALSGVFAPRDISAADIPYDNTSSGLAATNMQDAIDEIADLLGGE